jgi:beta-1,4-mannosyltransferase
MIGDGGTAVDSRLRGGAVSEFRAPVRIASFPPPIPQNPYQRLLYDGLAAEGVQLVPSAPLRFRWLLASRRGVDVLHFHWPEIYYRHRGAASRVDVALSWVRLGLFALRLRFARALGYVIVWTVHQVQPHESPSPLLDRVGTRVLARASHLLVANDRATAELASTRFRLRRVPSVVPHGSYVGVYPPGRPRADVRRELGVDPDAFLILSLGHLRRYKGLGLLLDAFAATASLLPDAVLVVAGLSLDAEGAEDLSAAARVDPRIKPLLGFVPDDRVAELFGAADAAVLARSDGGTSGALLLALSHGTPVIAGALPSYRELVSEDGAGWLYEPGDPRALAAAFEQAVAEPPARRAQRAAAASAQAEALRWDDSARLLAQLVREAKR